LVQTKEEEEEEEEGGLLLLLLLLFSESLESRLLPPSPKLLR